MECVHAFGGWQELEPDKLNEIRDKLSNFESMTWHEILVKAKKQHHSIPVGDFPGAAQTRLQELKLDDVDELVSLRLKGRERIYGVRQAGALLLLWWDPSHAIYPAKKKHT